MIDETKAASAEKTTHGIVNVLKTVFYASKMVAYLPAPRLSRSVFRLRNVLIFQQRREKKQLWLKGSLSGENNTWYSKRIENSFLRFENGCISSSSQALEISFQIKKCFNFQQRQKQLLRFQGWSKMLEAIIASIDFEEYFLSKKKILIWLFHDFIYDFIQWRIQSEQ